MELRQLVYFEAVARLGGFSRAAEQLRIAQPAVSAQIKRLERELGTPLFDRTTRRVSLTAAGELLVARARSVLAEVEHARADLADLAEVLRGELRVGATQVVGSLDLPQSLAHFHRRYPDVTLSLRGGLIADLLADLEAGELDVVLGPIHRELLAGFVAETLVSEHLVLVTPPEHRLAEAGAAASLAAVQSEPFVCLAEGSGLDAILAAAATAAGFTPWIPFRTHSPASIRELVAAGLGVALLAESAARPAGPNVHIHRLQPTPKHPAIGLIHRRGRRLAPAARAWQKQLRDDHVRA